MSIFSNIANAEHTFVAWFEKEVSAFEQKVPTIEKDVDAATKYATGVLTIVRSQAQIEPGSQADNIISTALSDLKVASSVVYDAGAHPSVAGAFQAVADNLSGLTNAAGIKNPSKVATVSKVVSTLAALASAFLTVAPVAA